jgi:hypothetical protein
MGYHEALAGWWKRFEMLGRAHVDRVVTRVDIAE